MVFGLTLQMMKWIQVHFFHKKNQVPPSGTLTGGHLSPRGSVWLSEVYEWIYLSVLYPTGLNKD